MTYEHVPSGSQPKKQYKVPEFRDWYCFQYWEDGQRKYKLTSMCKRTMELCKEAQNRQRAAGLNTASCSFREKAYCVRMRVHALESDYLDCSETWHQCMLHKSMADDKPERYKSLTTCELRE